jgi:hypothetical protein
MAKQKKKRTKKYSGVDAAIDRPIVTHISAANRTRLGQWWFEHKQIMRPVLITAGVIIVIIILILEVIHITTS